MADPEKMHLQELLMRRSVVEAVMLEARAKGDSRWKNLVSQYEWLSREIDIRQKVGNAPTIGKRVVLGDREGMKEAAGLKPPPVVVKCKTARLFPRARARIGGGL